MDLSSEQRAQIERRCWWRAFEKNDLIIDHDDVQPHLYFIVEGRTRIVYHSLQGREIVFDDRTAGQYCGEIAAIDRAERSLRVVGLTPGRVAALPSSVLEELLIQHPPVLRRFLEDLANTIRTANQRILQLSVTSPQTRVMAELLRIAVLNSEDGKTAEIHPIPKQSELAMRAGTTRETVNRAIRELARSGILHKGHRRLIVDDIERLTVRVNKEL